LEIGKSRGMSTDRIQRIYEAALARCAPDALVRVPADAPRDVVAIGKCAAALLRGVARQHDVRDALAIVPQGYPRAEGVECLTGGHPEMTPDSFAAGRRLLEFVDAHDDLLFLVSGGGSACVEWPLPGHAPEELIANNARLVASGMPIGAINAERKKLSAIKGGRLAERVRGRCVTLVYSDVATGRLADVASGPTIGNGEAILIADNSTLINAAADIAREQGWDAVVWPEQIECDVEDAAQKLAAVQLEDNQLLVAGGEPTIAVKGNGKGGRCCELAIRFATKAHDKQALFASSDGVDGNSGAAGVVVERALRAADRHRIDAELAASNSFALVELVGRAIMIPPTGNNLRDLFLMARR
jgi:glycerate 2-kinase